MITFKYGSHINGNDITVLKDPPLGRDPVHNRLIYGSTCRPRERRFTVIKERRYCAVPRNDVVNYLIHVISGHPGADLLIECPEDLLEDLPG